MMYNKEQLKKDLKILGIKSGSTLEVHSSLKSIGYVQGGANTLIEALIETLTSEGTLLMSAYPISKPLPLTDMDREIGLAWKTKRVIPGTNSKTAMGLIVDEFVSREDTVLGNGRHSTCAWGKDKELYRDGYDPILKVNGKVLLIGVGIDRCSSLHLAEKVKLPKEIQQYYAIPQIIRDSYPDDEWAVGVEGPPGDAWAKIYQWGINNNIIETGKVGKAKVSIFHIKPLVEEYRKQRKESPFELFEVEKPI